MNVKFYDYALTILKPFIFLLGKIGLPKRKIEGRHFYKISHFLENGDILLTKTNYEFSNLINPSELKHGAIFVGEIFGDKIPYVFESIGAGAVLTDLYTFCRGKDIILITRYKDAGKFSFIRLPKIVLRLKGVKYDYLFNKDGKAFYCFELCGVILKEIFPNINLKLNFIVNGKEIYDHNTYTDPNNFSIIYDSRKDNE